MWYTNIVKQKLSHTTEEKELKRSYKNQKPTCPTLIDPIKILNWKPCYIHRGPGTDQFRPCACCLSLLSSYELGSCRFGWLCFLGHPPSLWCSLPNLYQGSLSPGGRDFMETICLDLGVPRSFLCIMPGLGLCTCSCLLQEEFPSAECH